MFELIAEYRALGQHIASILLGLAMWRWGSAPEKMVATAFVVLFTLPAILFELGAGAAMIFAAGGAFYTGIDIVAACIFLAIALNANRNYTLWIAGFQLVATAAHLVRYAVDVVTPLAHAIMVIGPSYFQLILMLVGLIRHVRRKKKYGEYRDWRAGFSPPFIRKTMPDGLERQL